MALIWVNCAAESSDNFIMRVEFGNSSTFRFTWGDRNGEWGWDENRSRR
jgi:hypothetical protein